MAEGKKSAEKTERSRLGRAKNRLVETYEAWRDARTIRLGAGLAYYSVFTLAPITIIAVSIAGVVYGADAAEGLVVERTQETLGTEAAQLLEDALVFADSPGVGASASVIGILALIVSASVLFRALQDALNTVWDVPPQGGWRVTLRRRLISFGIVISCGFLLLAALTVQVLITLLQDLPGDLEAVQELTQVLSGLAPLIGIGLVMALLFKYMPDAESEWRDALIAGLLTAVVASIGNALLGPYLGSQTPVSMTGASTSIVLVLLWVYYQAQILLVGAHLTKALGDRRIQEGQSPA
jgi:membrane protein